MHILNWRCGTDSMTPVDCSPTRVQFLAAAVLGATDNNMS